MRAFLFCVLLIIFGLHQGYQWFKSPKYTAFLERNKKKSWTSQTLLYSGLYWTTLEEWGKAFQFFDRCGQDDFKKSVERPLCLYYKARALDELKRFPEAMSGYFSFLEEFPNHPKASLARNRLDNLKTEH
ncbi:MAG: hypothetical protein HY747_03860 [Elusimicrobia bacterium]|nr:hypothetical protein [Elusimicrobiota bacterium]